MALVLGPLLFPIGTPAQAPDIRVLEREAEWKALPALDPKVPSPSVSEGADVLRDDHRVSFHRAKPQFITIVHERKLVMRFSTREAIKRWSRFTLPQSLDPSYDFQDVRWEERSTATRPRYYDVRLLKFQSRVIGHPDRARTLEAEGKVIRQQIKAIDRMRMSWSFQVDVNGIQPGDTVEVIYKYDLPYDENWQHFNSARIFLHDELYKHQCSLLIQAHTMQGFHVAGAAPDTTWDDGNQRNWQWEMNDLVALADEENTRPYLDLTHIHFATQQDADRYMQRHPLSGQVIPIPYWAYIMRQREASAHWWRRVALKRIPDAQNQKLKRSIDRLSIGVPKDDVVGRMHAVHNAIAKDFEFRWDDAWFEGRDGKMPKYGNMMEDGYVREIGRYALYSKLMSTIRLKYYTAYVIDKRVGHIRLEPMLGAWTMDDLSPVWNNEYLFVLNDGSGPLLMHSKLGRQGLFANELPFYWQGTQALVGDVDKLWNGTEDPTPELIPIPVLRPEFNTRTTNVKIDIDPPSLTMKAAVNLLLSGQFSTLCRGAYLHGTRDSTVHPLYSRRLYDIDGVTDLQVELGQVQQEAPFRIPVHISFTLKDRSSPINDSIWQVDISDLVPHVLPQNFDSGSRDLPFYFDYPQVDRYVIELKLPEGMELATPPVGLEVNGKGFSLHRAIEQDQPDRIIFTSELRVEQTQVKGDDQLEKLASLIRQASKPVRLDLRQDRSAR